MKLTRRGYVTLAQVIKYGIIDDDARLYFVKLLLPILADANLAFNSVKFCLTCNVPVQLSW